MKDYFFVDIRNNTINPIVQIPSNHFKYYACSQNFGDEKISFVDPTAPNEAVVARLHDYGLEIVATLTPAHVMSISCMAFDPSDRYILLGGDLFDHGLHCWDIEQEQYLWRADIPQFAPLKKIWWHTDRIYVVPWFCSTYVLKHPHYCMAVLIKRYWDRKSKARQETSQEDRYWRQLQEGYGSEYP